MAKRRKVGSSLLELAAEAVAEQVDSAVVQRYMSMSMLHSRCGGRKIWRQGNWKLLKRFRLELRFYNIIVFF